jgi:galactose mutarotase-like enzyme
MARHVCIGHPSCTLPPSARRRYNHCFIRDDATVAAAGERAPGWPMWRGGADKMSGKATEGEGEGKVEGEHELAPVAVLKHPASGRTMTVLTTQPGVQVGHQRGGERASLLACTRAPARKLRRAQVYASNWMAEPPGAAAVVRGGGWWQHGALCLETEGLPNATGEPRFPGVVVPPGGTYAATTVHVLEW